jgi:hypothetical protein
VIIAGGLMIMALWTTPLGMVLGAAVFALGITLSTPGVLLRNLRDCTAK